MESPLSNTDPQVQSSKKTYRTPKLMDYGTVAQVTQTGNTIAVSDGVSLSS